MGPIMFWDKKFGKCFKNILDPKANFDGIKPFFPHKKLGFLLKREHLLELIH